MRALLRVFALLLALPLAAQQVSSAASLPMDAAVPPDKEVMDFLAPRAAEIKAEYSRVLVQAPQGLRRGAPGEDNLLGYWACDAMRQAGSRLMGVPVHAAFTNRGGLRQDLAAGAVTVGDITQLMPFENELIVIELTGAELRQCVVDGLQRRNGEPISGLTVKALGPPEQPGLTVTLSDGSPLDPTATYRLATSDYLFAGGDSIPALKNGRRPFHAGVTLRQCFLDACAALQAEGKTLQPPPPGRYQFSDSIREAIIARRKVMF